MKVLMITGDKNFKPGHERYDLQRSAVEDLTVLYWGRGSILPKIPAGDFDVVTAQDPFWRGLFALHAASRSGAKCNIQVHTDLSVYKGLKHILAQITLRHADSIRVVSKKIKGQVERVGVTAKITVLPVFVDVSRFHSVVRSVHEGKNILWVGRFEEEKDPLLAVEVLKEVLKTEPSATLVMLGAGSLGQQISERAANLPVETPGWQDPVVFLDTADVALCTSKHESFGASIVEALAAGVPVVSPDVGVAKEAGANVVSYKDLAAEVVKVLESGHKGHLQLTLLTKEAWAQKWKDSL